jgi:RIO-like serine/threonine protein kinase
MYCVDKILAILIDSQWHSYDDLRERQSMPFDQLNIILDFLEEHGFISKKINVIKITPRGLKCLNLPV